MRVENKRQRLHVVSKEFLTYYVWNPNRSSKATDAIGILPSYDGVIIHEYWKSYYQYSCTHSLCNVHNIGELKGIFELTKQQWAQEMIDLLLEIKAKVDELKQESRPLSTAEKDAFKKRYDHIVAEGYLVNPPPEPVKKRGRPKQGKARNMLRRLSEHLHEVLAFMEDYRIAFDNNQAEEICALPRSGKKSPVFSAVPKAPICSVASEVISPLPERTRYRLSHPSPVSSTADPLSLSISVFRFSKNKILNG